MQKCSGDSSKLFFSPTFTYMVICLCKCACSGPRLPRKRALANQKGFRGSNGQVQQVGCTLFRIRLMLISTWSICVNYTHISRLTAHVLTLPGPLSRSGWRLDGDKRHSLLSHISDCRGTSHKSDYLC